MRFALGVIALIIFVLALSAALVTWAFDHDVENAEQHCYSLGAEPRYTYGTHYICVTPDGRVVE